MALDRRHFTRLALAFTAASLLDPLQAKTKTGPKLQFGPAEAFSFDLLIARAEKLAQSPYQAPPRPDPAIVQQIDYDAHGKLRYRKEAALWADGPSPYPITFQHVGRYFPKTVAMHQVSGGMAQEILYDPASFMGGPDHVAARLPSQPSAYAGFWVQEDRSKTVFDRSSQQRKDWKAREPWATFLGASYFRAVGELGQVGLSARAVALAPGTAQPEEFPDFTAFWFEPAKTAADPVIVHALLDGPSLCGAYRFALYRTQGVVMEIKARLFLRRPIERFGLAPLTSMFWFGETRKADGIDWRPEVHDSDGLALWTGRGERIWRPLNNPASVKVSSFIDDNPRGFGLMQRDRDVDHYLDGVLYHKRPSAWVEPLGAWGKGAVQLTELPTDDEIHDNIVAMWVPAEPTRAGQRYDLAYRLHWLADEPYPAPLARCVATRIGRGGQPGHPRPAGVRKFVVEFYGTPLAKLPFGTLPEAIVTASRGTLSKPMMEALPNDRAGHWRAIFDLTVDGHEPVELRCYLKNGATILSETWLSQYHPF
jgi:glucans biosynthesis protein